MKTKQNERRKRHKKCKSNRQWCVLYLISLCVLCVWRIDNHENSKTAKKTIQQNIICVSIFLYAESKLLLILRLFLFSVVCECSCVHEWTCVSTLIILYAFLFIQLIQPEEFISNSQCVCCFCFCSSVPILQLVERQ